MGKKYKTVILGNGFDLGLYKKLSEECAAEQERYIFSLREFLKRSLDKHYHDSICDSFKRIFYDSTNIDLNQAIKDIQDNCTGTNNISDALEIICNFEANYFDILTFFMEKNIPRNDEDGAQFILNLSNYDVTDKLPKPNNKNKSVSEKINQFKKIHRNICLMYGCWFFLLERYIDKHQNLLDARKGYYCDFYDEYIDQREIPIILTINYNYDMTMYYPQTEFLHGHFDSDLKNGKIELQTPSGAYKILFDKMALDKYNCVRKSTASKYYQDLFFRKEDKRKYGNVLIFGVSFVRSKNNSILKTAIKNRPYMNIIDVHLLVRLSELLDDNRCDSVDINAFSQADSQNYKQIFEDFSKVSEIELPKQIYSYYKDKKFNIVGTCG